MRIRFLRDYHYQGMAFSAGDTLTMGDDKAGEFIRRGVCRACADKPQPAAVKGVKPETAALAPANEKAVKPTGKPRS